MKIIQNGAVVSTVLFDKDASQVVKTAVGEYCLFVSKCFEQDQSAFNVMPTDFDYFVVIGSDAFAKQVGVVIPRETFDDDTVFIQVKGNYVFLDGGKRGVLYAVYEFLERFLGVRFYASNLFKTPYASNLDLDDVTIVYTPPFKIRNVYCYQARNSREFCARLRLNVSAQPNMLEPYGGSLDFAKPECHTTFPCYVNPNDPEIGIDVHPEYFAYDVATGKRVGKHYPTSPTSKWGEGEICWTHPDVIDIITQKLKKIILQNPDKSIFSVSMNDYSVFCQCPRCTQIALQHGKDGEPRWIAPILFALNVVGKRIKEWQKTEKAVANRTIFIETLAYHQANEPPIDMTVEDNVIIRYCAKDCYYHNLDDETCIVNGKSRSQIQDWNKITDNLFIWDYCENYALPIAHTSILKVVQSRMQYYATHKVVGIFNEYCEKENVGTLYQVKEYLFARLLWNPFINFEQEFDEAMEFFYGNSAQYLSKVEQLFLHSLDDCASQIQSTGQDNGFGFHLPSTYCLEKIYFSDDFLQQSEQLFAQALQVENNADVKFRVQREYAIFRFVKAYINRDADKEAVVKAFAHLDSFGITNFRLESFRRQVFNGEMDDWFSDAVAKRNRKNYYKTLDIHM